MIKGILLGIVLGIAGVAACVYAYFATGRAPIAVEAAEMPFERKFAHMGLHSYLDKLPHPEPQVPSAGLTVNIVVLFSLILAVGMLVDDAIIVSEFAERRMAEGMAPKPPQLFKGVGVTDDEAWESYWKVKNGIRMTGMPGFKGHLTETEIWLVTVLVKNADKITPAVKVELTGSPTTLAAPGAPAVAVKK